MILDPFIGHCKFADGAIREAALSGSGSIAVYLDAVGGLIPFLSNMSLTVMGAD
jgi:hypothetical protein